MVVIFDQALYAKAMEIIWKGKDIFSDIVPRMGAFHTVCTLLAIIRKLFQDAGLKDLCIESGVIAEGSIEGVLEGNKYNRAVQFHKLLCEALLRLAWNGFGEWIASNDKGNTFASAMKLIEVFSDDISQKTFGEVLSYPSFEALAILFQKYLDSLRTNGGDLAAYWMMYIDVVQIMLNLLRASREGDWSLHLSAIYDLIPWCFSYDQQNYARYLSCYNSEMTHLEQEYLEIHA